MTAKTVQSGMWRFSDFKARMLELGWSYNYDADIFECLHTAYGCRAVYDPRKMRKHKTRGMVEQWTLDVEGVLPIPF